MAPTIQKENKKFSEWLETMVSEESEDYYIGGTAIEKGETADLQVAFEAGQSEKVSELYKIISKFKTDDAPLLKEEPCCKVNMKNEKAYCQFHGLLRALDMWTERS